MTKSSYLINSAKLLAACCGLLFAANLFVFIGKIDESTLFFGNKLSDIAFYVVLILGFLAFNGEGLSYKISRDTKRKSQTKLLKAVLLFAFILRFIKRPFEAVLLSAPAGELSGCLSRLFLGAFNTAASYGFLFTIVSLWYCKRDKSNEKLMAVEVASFVIGIISNLYKMLNYASAKYALTYLGEGFTNLFSNDIVLYSLVLVQFAVNVLMFACVIKTYKKNLTGEHYEKEQARKKMIFARNIYSTDGFGVDNLEDDYLNN